MNTVQAKLPSEGIGPVIAIIGSAGGNLFRRRRKYFSILLKKPKKTVRSEFPRWKAESLIRRIADIRFDAVVLPAVRYDNIGNVTGWF